MAVASWTWRPRAHRALWRVALCFALGACSSGSHGDPSQSVTTDAGEDTMAPAPSSDAGDAGADDASLPPRTFLRIAHLSPDTPPLDVCVAAHGTGSFQGPLIGQFAAALAGDAGLPEDAGLPGVTYAEVSAYIPIDPGQYDVRLVPAGAPSCSAALAQQLVDGDPGEPDDAAAASDAAAGAASGGAVDAALPDASVPADGGEAGLIADAAADAEPPVPDWTNLSTIAQGTYTTLVVAGDRSPAGSDAALQVTTMTDDAVLTGAAVVLRAVNAVPSAAALDFGLGPGAGADAGWLALVTSVRFGTAGAQAGFGEGTLDPNGYLSLAPLLAQTVAARPSGADATADTAIANDVEIDTGSIATFFAVGGKTGDAHDPPSLLLCIDNMPVGSILADCSVAQP